MFFRRVLRQGLVFTLDGFWIQTFTQNVFFQPTFSGILFVTIVTLKRAFALVTVPFTTQMSEKISFRA